MKKILASTLVLSIIGIAGFTTLTKANSDKEDIVNLEQMAKKENITLDELTDKLTKEGKLVEAGTVTEEMSGAEKNDAVADKEEDVVDLEQMAKEQNISLDELIEKLTKEGKLTEAAPMAEATEK